MPWAVPLGVGELASGFICILNITEQMFSVKGIALK